MTFLINGYFLCHKKNLGLDPDPFCRSRFSNSPDLNQDTEKCQHPDPDSLNPDPKHSKKTSPILPEQSRIGNVLPKNETN
jgi:hypothetical protein